MDHSQISSNPNIVDPTNSGMMNLIPIAKALKKLVKEYKAKADSQPSSIPPFTVKIVKVVVLIILLFLLTLCGTGVCPPYY